MSPSLVFRPPRPALAVAGRLIAALLVTPLGAGALPRTAMAADGASAGASAWAKSAQSEARLLGGGALPDGRGLLAGVEIRLRPHFITYWRDPGDAGVPPTFAFAGSSNLKSATVRYPAPSSLDEAGSKAFGYEGGVLFPVLVVPQDASKPVELAMTLDYATCNDICLPAHADLRLSLEARRTSETTRVLDALALVPRPSMVGAAGPAPEILAVTAPDAAGSFSVRATLPGGDDGRATLFVEAPEGWAYAAGRAEVDGPGRVVFPVKQLAAPGGVVRPAAPLTLTLVAPGGAVEAPVTLDGAGTTP